MVKFLIDHNADVNTSDDDEKTPLMAVIMTGNIPLARLIIEHNAKANAKTDFSRIRKLKT